MARSTPAKILMATAEAFWRADRGDRARIASLCQFLLDEGHAVAVYYAGRISPTEQKSLQAAFPTLQLFPFETTEPRGSSTVSAKPSMLTRMRRAAGKGLHHGLPPTALRRVQHMVYTVKAAFRSLRWSVGGARTPGASTLTSPAQRRAFADTCDQFKPDVILVEYIRLAYLVSPEMNALKIIDTIDVMHLRTQRFHARRMAHWIDLNREEEAAILSRFDAVVAIQEQDAKVFRSMLPESRVVTCGHASAVKALPLPDDAVVEVLYVATGASANVDAITWFLKAVWPRVLPGRENRLHLTLAGEVGDRVPPHLISGPVALTGYQEDLENAYVRSAIVINPVRVGGGLKIKCVEALCHSRPLLTTSVGMEGMEDGAGDAFFVEDTPEAMATRLGQLIDQRELRLAVADQALAYAHGHFVPNKAYDELRKLLNE